MAAWISSFLRNACSFSFASRCSCLTMSAGVRERHCSQGKVRKREDMINKRGRGAVNVVGKDFSHLS